MTERAHPLAYILPIVIVLSVTCAAFVLLNKNEAERKDALARTGEVIVIDRQPQLEATVMESLVVSSETVASTSPILSDDPVPPPPVPVPPLKMATYIEVIDSCGAHYEGECVNVRTGPSTSTPSVLKLRNGIVLATDGIVESDGVRWHRIVFNEWIRYPDRLPKKLYIAEEYGREIEVEAPGTLSTTTATTSKYIVVDRSEQKLTAYEGDDELFMEETISTGLDATPTPRGTFTIFSKMPSRYMQGPLPGISTDYYDLPGVPWSLYFTAEGGAIHGAYWHDKFGRQWSHGCVNLPTEKARELYLWADLGTKVIIRD